MIYRLASRLWRRRLLAVVLCSLSAVAVAFPVARNFLKTQPVHSVRISDSSKRLEYFIHMKWDSQPVDHDQILISLGSGENGMKLSIDAPFFNDPANPGTKPGEPLLGLWNFEVVEVFFLNDKRQYLEVEVCPHGQHLVLLLSDYRKAFKQMLPLEYKAQINGNKWTGEAVIPWEYFPPDTTRFNAYAIHGSDPNRVYESLYPVPKGQFKEPDFHRLDFFKEFNLGTLWPKDESGKPAKIHSPLWD